MPLHPGDGKYALILWITWDSVQYEPLIYLWQRAEVSHDHAGTKLNGNSRTPGVKTGPGQQPSRTPRDNPIVRRPWYLQAWIGASKLDPRRVVQYQHDSRHQPEGGGELRVTRAYETMHSLNVIPQGSTPWLVGPVVRFPIVHQHLGSSDTVVSTREPYHQLVEPCGC